jgi:hypothetical protein
MLVSLKKEKLHFHRRASHDSGTLATGMARLFFPIPLATFNESGQMAERSMALRSGDWSYIDQDTIRSLERGVGSNPTLFIFCCLSQPTTPM